MVLGIRPDVIRASLILRALRNRLGSRLVFVWSGQHYSHNLKDVFFHQLGVESPDIELACNTSTEQQFIADLTTKLGDLLQEIQPASCCFLGDTNTVLGTITCASLNIPIVHIEGCMRSYDWRMPEEKYRTIADHLSDVIYAYLPSYAKQGVAEGIAESSIIVTGNPIVDVLDQFFLSGKLRLQLSERDALFSELDIDNRPYILMTAHRRENVENLHALRNILKLAESTRFPVVFPASYRTQASIKQFGLALPSNLRLVNPIGYVEFLEIATGSELVLTDSGTVVEETSVLGIPTIQMRHSTERPEVYDTGGCIKFDPTLEYVATEFSQAIHMGLARSDAAWSHGLGDGKASERIVDDLCKRVEEPECFRGHDVRLTSKPFQRNFGAGTSERGAWRDTLL